MNEASQFVFARYESDLAAGIVRFHYQLTHHGQAHDFVETLTFTAPAADRIPKITQQVERACQALHLMLGISYWKLFCPAVITMPYALSQTQATFWETFYTKGLGEFFYRNNIDFRSLVHFPSSPSKGDEEEFPLELTDTSLVMLGAGKDSIVTAELLKRNKKEFSLFTVNPFPIHKEVGTRIGAALYQIKREIDPKLFELNKQPGSFNGHIPITAITSMLGVLAAIVYDFRYVIASNEESANYGNVDYLDIEINHQWSKSYEYELLFAKYLETFVTKSVTYFSLLRPMKETRIIQKFVHHEKYFDVFTSCNQNFRIQGNTLKGQWCGQCPKCAFIFLLLAAFLPKEKVISIFGKNFFADANLMSLYKELLGLEGFKPFECVGTPEESVAAFLAVADKGSYKDDIVVKELTDVTRAWVTKHGDPTTSVFSLSKIHSIPKEFEKVITSA